ncbi:HEPN domain-containing protein [uncultured Dokdonia sp.]|uniref:HEPN domain-containing protein n=1 Tax=uncultured Dokdonia sp. TaxID=575653 RepID=UPI002611AE1E|nr:HEPN domain-containing protein [uncultured Dokdonia sp.]
MLDDIIYTFDKNFLRIKQLIKLYKDVLVPSNVSSKGDVLRAVTVLTHSTFEDFLRNLLRWKLPNADPDVLNKISLTGKERRTKIEFRDIVNLRGKTVDEVIKASIQEHLNKVSFNNTADIESHLNDMGVDTNPLKKYYSMLNDMIKRRHNIVHKADRTNDDDISKTRIKTIRISQVERWIENVDSFVVDLISQMR